MGCRVFAQNARHAVQSPCRTPQTRAANGASPDRWPFVVVGDAVHRASGKFAQVTHRRLRSARTALLCGSKARARETDSVDVGLAAAASAWHRVVRDRSGPLLRRTKTPAQLKPSYTTWAVAVRRAVPRISPVDAYGDALFPVRAPRFTGADQASLRCGDGSGFALSQSRTEEIGQDDEYDAPDHGEGYGDGQQGKGELRVVPQAGHVGSLARVAAS